MESDFEFEYQMSLRLVHKLLSKVAKMKESEGTHGRDNRS